MGGQAAHAQTYPTRPIQVIVAFAGGSASDVVMRILLERMGKSIGQPFVVDNRPGAGGNIGTARGRQGRSRRLYAGDELARAARRQPHALPRARL